MTLKIVLMLALAVFILLMAFWVVKSEEVPKKNRSFLDPNKSYKKAKEYGLNLPEELNDALPGV